MKSMQKTKASRIKPAKAPLRSMIGKDFNQPSELEEWVPIGPKLGGSWDLVSTVISTLSGVNYKYSYLNYNPSY